MLVAGQARAQWIASSVDGFSGEQGEGGWYYGYYPSAPFIPAHFEQLPHYDVPSGAWYIQAGPGGFWTGINDRACHPNGTMTSEGRQPVEQWPVRRWVSSVKGSYELRVTTIDLNGGGGNGVVMHLFVDGAEVDTEVVNNGGHGGTPTIVPVTLSVGSVIDLAIDPRESNDLFDATGSSLMVTGCYADVDGDGTLSIFDFLQLVNSFNAGSDFADCDQSGGIGVFDLFDFLCFVNAFNAGC